MTLRRPLWMQAASGDPEIEYSASDYRSLLDGFFRLEGIARPDVVAGGLAVSQRSAGANFSIDVAAGRCVVEGDDVADQGRYVCDSTDVENITVPAAPVSGTRTHRIVARVKDPLHNATWTTYEWALELLEDTGAGTPALPDSAINLASVTVAAGQVSVTDADITDLRGSAALIGSQPPTVFSDADRPPHPYSGEMIWREDLDCYEVGTGGTFYEIPRRGASGSAWSTYTPSLTATTTSPNLGSTAMRQGRYMQVGRMVTAEVILQFSGTGISAGSGVYLVSLPVVARTQATGRRTGTAYVWDNSASSLKTGNCYIDFGATTTARVMISEVIVTDSAPHAWAASDEIGLTISYEAAT